LANSVIQGCEIEAKCPAKLAITDVQKTRFVLIFWIVSLGVLVILNLADFEKSLEYPAKISKSINFLIPFCLILMKYKRLPSLILITPTQVFLINGLFFNPHKKLFTYRSYYRIPRREIRKTILWGYSFTGREFNFHVKNKLSVYVSSPSKNSDSYPVGTIDTRRCRDLLIGKTGFGLVHHWGCYACVCVLIFFAKITSK
jgi:hypothetical protein